MSKTVDGAEALARTVASLSKQERQWCRRRYCGFCEASLLGSMCYAQSGEHTLPIIEGVRDQEEVIDLGPACDMDKRRGQALAAYKPRTARTALETRNG